MGKPKALASLLRAITQPSLLERMAMGLPLKTAGKSAHKMRKSCYNRLVRTFKNTLFCTDLSIFFLTTICAIYLK